MHRSPDFAGESAGANVMDANDQNTQGAEVVRSEPESVRAAKHSRRSFLFKLALLVNGAVGAVLAVPIVGYLLGPAIKKGGYDSWISLGPLSDFPEGETRLVDYRNPVTTSWDGPTGDIPCWVRRVSGTTFQVFAINCAHLGCRCGGLLSRSCFFAHVMEVLTMRMARGLRGRRSGVCLSIRTGSMERS
jgi:hypothetical protein